MVPQVWRFVEDVEVTVGQQHGWGRGAAAP
jgi:hypothetical protein